MSELIRNEIGENKISEKIGDVNWVENKIKDSYKEIYETKDQLKSLKAEMTNNLSGEKLKSLIENELTTDHVKQVLEQALTKFSSAKQGMEGFNAVYAEMGAGLTFNLQLALAKLGAKFDRGIDGMYGSKDTRKRVEEFQNAWNVSHPDQKISVDGWAGKETVSKIIAALSDAGWDKSKVAHATSNETNKETKEDDITDIVVKDMQELLAKIPDGKGWKENVVYNISLDGGNNEYQFYGNGRMAHIGQDMYDWEKKNGKIYVNGKEWTPLNNPKANPDKNTEEEKVVDQPSNKIVLRNVRGYTPGTITISSTPDAKGRYSYERDDKSKGSMSAGEIGGMLTAAYRADLDKFFEDKSYKFTDIFTADQMKDKNIQKFMNFFSMADKSFAFDDVRIAFENGKKFIVLDYDNRGYDRDRTKNRKFPYDEVISDNKFQRTKFLGMVREDIIKNAIPNMPK